MKYIALQTLFSAAILLTLVGRATAMGTLEQSYRDLSASLKTPVQNLSKSLHAQENLRLKTLGASEPAPTRIIPGVYKRHDGVAVSIRSWALQLQLQIEIPAVYWYYPATITAFIEPDSEQGIKKYIGTGTISVACATSAALVEIFPVKEDAHVRLFVKVKIPPRIIKPMCSFDGTPTWQTFSSPFELQNKP